MAIIHVFESAGLGVAPFRFTGIEEKIFSIPGVAGTRKPGGSCEYCGTAIIECCWIQDANGKKFYVGNECVRKTGDTGLFDTVKKALARKRKEARAESLRVKYLAARELLSNPAVIAVFSKQPHPNAYFAGQGKTMVDYYIFMIDNVRSAVPGILKNFHAIINAG